MSSSEGAVLLIGAGRMGGALIKGWLAAGSYSAIHVVEPQPAEALRALVAEGRIVLHTRYEAAGGPALAAVVLAVKPQILKGETALLQAIGRSGGLVLSIAAGLPSAFLAPRLGQACRLVRAMPNTPGAIGRGITVLYGDTRLDSFSRGLAERLMSALGETLWIEDEALMDAVTAVSGSGPAYVFLLAEALAAAGREQGLEPETADRLARATVAGAGALLAVDARPAAQLRQEVTSPGGTTEAALRVLMADGGLGDLMRQAITAATARGKELGKG